MEEYKQVIVVRTDLEMGKGKIASQVAHASLCAYLKSDREIRKKWLEQGGKKIVLKVSCEKDLLDIFYKAQRALIPCCIIKDAAKTQLHEPAYTSVALGPDDENKINKITGGLKLL